MQLGLSLALSRVSGAPVAAVAPVLSSPTDTAVASSQNFTATVSTTSGSGTLYWVVSTASNAPSAAQVKAGQMHTGAAASAAGSQAVSGTGAQAIGSTASALGWSTTGYVHFMHEDAVGQSNVVSGDGFTTATPVFVDGLSIGTGATGTTSTTLTITTTADVAAGDVVCLACVCPNTGTADSTSANEITGVTDTASNTWSKAGEQVNTVAGVAADGVTVAVFYTRAANAMASGATITITYANSITSKAAVTRKFTGALGAIQQATGSPKYANPNSGNDFGSLSYSSLASKSRIYFRGMCKGANIAAPDLTPSSNFTDIDGLRSHNSAAAICAMAEFRVNTSTGETSAPTYSGNTQESASVFIALEHT